MMDTAQPNALSRWGDIKVFDEQILLENFEGQSKLARRYLLAYIEDSREGFDELLSFLQAGDVENIRFKAHLLMSSAKLIGAFRLAACLEFLSELPVGLDMPELDRLDFMMILSATLTEICEFLNNS